MPIKETPVWVFFYVIDGEKLTVIPHVIFFYYYKAKPGSWGQAPG